MEINSISCATSIKNTGTGDCTFIPGFVKGWFRVGNNFKVDPTVAATPESLKAYMTSLILSDDPSQRIYPVKGIKSITDSSEDTTFQTFGDGTQVPVRDGFMNFTLQYVDGGMCLHLALRSMNGTGGKYVFWDQNNVLMGTGSTDADGVRSLVGAPALFYENKWKLNDGSNVANFGSFFSIDPYYLNEALAFVPAGFNLGELSGLQTMVLRQGSVAPVGGVIRFKALAGCDYANQFSLYSDELIDETLYIATNKATGAQIDITSVTATGSGATGEFILTLDSTDPDYPATTTALIDIRLVGPTELAAADIVGFESNTLTVKRG